MVDLTLRVEGADQAPATAQRLADQLFDELRAARVGRVGRVPGPAQPGGKSGAAQVVGQLAVSGAASGALLTIHRTVVAFLNRSKARSVTVKIGDTEVVITAATGHEVARAMELAAERAGAADTPEA